MSKKKDTIEDWDDFEEVDLSKKRYRSDSSDDTKQKLSIIGKNRSDETIERQRRSLTKTHHKKFQEKYPSLETLLKDFKKVHRNHYDYSKVNLPNKLESKVIIICKIHGEFEQSAFNHLQGRGCKRCASILNNQKSKDKKIAKLTKKIDWKIVEELSAKGVTRTKIAEQLNIRLETLQRRMKKEGMYEYFQEKFPPRSAKKKT